MDRFSSCSLSLSGLCVAIFYFGIEYSPFHGSWVCFVFHAFFNYRVFFSVFVIHIFSFSHECSRAWLGCGFFNVFGHSFDLLTSVRESMIAPRIIDM